MTAMKRKAVKTFCKYCGHEIVADIMDIDDNGNRISLVSLFHIYSVPYSLNGSLILICGECMCAKPDVKDREEN